MKDLCLP